MKALLFTILLLVAAELTNGCNGGSNDYSKCLPPPGGCPIIGEGARKQVWLLGKDEKTCYNVSTPGCEEHGFPTLALCYFHCIAE
uniref:Putative secreted protein n=1 Tax=Amblyomma americanum TaxID=6943 RepID=A0A0C9S3B5_AMBAM